MNRTQNRATHHQDHRDGNERKQQKTKEEEEGLTEIKVKKEKENTRQEIREHDEQEKQGDIVKKENDTVYIINLGVTKSSKRKAEELTKGEQKQGNKRREGQKVRDNEGRGGDNRERRM